MQTASHRLRLILAGGGDAPDSVPLDKIFASWLGDRGRLLYLPLASRPKPDGYAQHRAWIERVFMPLGVTHLQMWIDLTAHEAAELEDFGGVYIGGGNTFTLLHLLRESGFDLALKQFALSGGAVYGGSAGAIVLGADIASCGRDDPNTVGLTDTRGLNLLDGHDIWCHFQPDQTAAAQAWCKASGRPLFAVPERGGLCAEGGRVRSAGSEACQTFAPG